MPKRRPTASSPGVPRRRARRTQAPAPFPTLEPFARRLESLRLERRLTQRALAARAEISANHYQDIAHAQANPTVIVLLRLASALGVSLDDLFGSLTPSSASERRAVLVDDLKRLVATSEQLADVVKRLATPDLASESHPDKRPDHI
jgi:transcriptional regulator with XRE-family HTH domain